MHEMSNPPASPFTLQGHNSRTVKIDGHNQIVQKANRHLSNSRRTSRSSTGSVSTTHKPGASYQDRGLLLLLLLSSLLLMLLSSPISPKSFSFAKGPLGSSQCRIEKVTARLAYMIAMPTQTSSRAMSVPR